MLLLEFCCVIKTNLEIAHYKIVSMNECMDGKSKAIPDPVCSDRHKVFLLHIGKDGTSLYKKTVDHLAYTSVR